MALIWQDLEGIAANWRVSICRLSAFTGAFLMSATSEFALRSQWVQSDFSPVTDAQWDEIEALVAKAYTEVVTDVAIGQVFPFISAAAPPGTLECDGTTYLRVDYPNLYALLDAPFIVDADHFQTPDLRGRTVVAAGTGSGLTPYAVADTGGEEAHLLTSPELAAHSHGVTDLGHAHSEGIALPNATTIGPGAPQPTALPGVGVTGVAATGISIQNAGGDVAHENRQPYYALRYAVWAE